MKAFMMGSRYSLRPQTLSSRLRRVAGLVGVSLVALSCTASQALGATDPRAYELVSPLDKNGGNLDRDRLVQDNATSGAAEAGDAIAYSGASQFADPAAGAPYSQYISRRTSAGWVTRNISPPVEAEVLDPVDFTAPLVPYLSSDLTKAVVNTNASLTPGASTRLGGTYGLYLWSEAGPTYQLLTNPWTTLTPDISSARWTRFIFEGASDDMRHIVFSSAGRQLTEDGLPPDDSGFEQSLYQWSDGRLEFISVLPDGLGTPFAQPGARSVLPRGQFFPGDGFLANDGKRVFFTSMGTLYVRENSETTEMISASQRAGDDPAAPQSGTFWAAEAAHGDRALFTSGTPLTEGATGSPGMEDLYLWDSAGSPAASLTNLTPGTASGAGVLGLAGASKDVASAYFVAVGALTGDAQEGLPNLYQWRAGQGVRLIGTLSDADGGVWSMLRNAAGGARYRDARTTANGDRLVFASRAKLTDYDNAGSRQVYLYDSPSGILTCISCDQAGDAPTGDAGLFPIDPDEESSTPYRLPRNISADGTSVIFETEQSLTSQDSNGQPDVYQWKSGGVTLITSGQGASGSRFVDASADARDVYFITRERLVRADIDNQNDMYDARVGGGFPDPAVPVPCEGDACQGPALAPSPFSKPLTSTFVGDGNARPSTGVRAKCGGRGGRKKASRCPKARRKCGTRPVRRKTKQRCVKQRRAAANNGRRR